VKLRWAVLYLWIALFSTAVIAAQIQLRQHQNEIKRNQTTACVQTYTIITRILTVLAPAITQRSSSASPYNDLNERWLYTLRLADPKRCLTRESR
jgi:hypothetical protein